MNCTNRIILFILINSFAFNNLIPHTQTAFARGVATQDTCYFKDQLPKPLMPKEEEHSVLVSSLEFNVLENKIGLWVCCIVGILLSFCICLSFGKKALPHFNS